MMVVYEDNHLIAAVKKHGQTVQQEPGKPVSLEEEVKSYIKVKANKPGDVFLGVIHRIDMPVSGIVLFAKTSKALARMNSLFEKREVSKSYMAVVEHTPPATTAKLIHWIKRNDNQHMVKAFEYEISGGEKAELIYTQLGAHPLGTRIHVQLLSGRKHQIRAQFSAIGCPIVGDKKYKSTHRFADHRILLHSSEMRFEHPITKLPVLLIHKPDF